MVDCEFLPGFTVAYWDKDLFFYFSGYSTLKLQSTVSPKQTIQKTQNEHTILFLYLESQDLKREKKTNNKKKEQKKTKQNQAKKCCII